MNEELKELFEKASKEIVDNISACLPEALRDDAAESIMEDVYIDIEANGDICAAYTISIEGAKKKKKNFVTKKTNIRDALKERLDLIDQLDGDEFEKEQEEVRKFLRDLIVIAKENNFEV